MINWGYAAPLFVIYCLLLLLVIALTLLAANPIQRAQNDPNNYSPSLDGIITVYFLLLATVGAGALFGLFFAFKGVV